jgi:hypothetical protein
VTFRSDVWAVDGNQTDALLARLMNQAASLGSQGVIGHLDCQVNATGPATAGIVITSGGVTVLGAESPYQGAYTGWNVGNDTSLSIGSTGGSPRSDMVVIRAEDPTWSGSPWGNPASGQILFPRVLTNVGGGATIPPGGYSCIPLARIDMPASTATVQQSYIHDLRQVCNPQRLLEVQTAAGPGTASNWTVSTTPHAWPPGASWQVYVPPWATTMVVTWDIIDIFWSTSPGTAARGYINPMLGASVTAPVLSMPQTLVSIPPPPAGIVRLDVSGGSTASIGPSIRGTTQTLQLAQVTDGVNNGILSATETSLIRILYEFQQLAAQI